MCINRYTVFFQALLVAIVCANPLFADEGENEGNRGQIVDTPATLGLIGRTPQGENALTTAQKNKTRPLTQKVDTITPAGKAADIKQQTAKAQKIPTKASIKVDKKIGNVILSLPNKNFMAPDIKWYEGHWQGMDTMELDPELKRKLNYPMGTSGIFVIEVTLNAALSGMLAGDILTAVEDTPVKNLKTFQLATRKIQNRTQAKVTILRKSNRVKNNKVMMRKHTYLLRGRNSLGFSQMESAPMIVPGDIRPHPYRGACTKCHAVGKGFQLAQDPDLITLPPPIISGSIARTHEPPHEYKGKCPICHQINKSLITNGTVPNGEVNNIVPRINQIFQGNMK